MKWTKTNKVYLIPMGIFLCDILVNIVLYVLVLRGVQIAMPIWLNILLSEALALIPALIYLFLQKKNPWKIIAHRRLRPSVILLLVLFSWLLMPLIMLINAISLLFVENAVSSTINDLVTYPYAVGISMMALLPALVEEFVCRGVIFHELRHDGIWKAILVSALLFGIIHINFNQMAYATVLGVALALVVEATDSIWSAVIVHFCFNASSVSMNYLYHWLAPSVVEESTQLYQSGIAYYSGMLVVIFFYAMVAMVTTAMAAGVFYLIAKRSERDWCMKLLFTGKTGPYPRRERVLTPLFVALLMVSLLLMLIV